MDLPDPVQMEIFRKMSPAKKLEIAQQLYWSARNLKAAALRQEHPDWSEEQIGEKVKEIFLYAQS